MPYSLPAHISLSHLSPHLKSLPISPLIYTLCLHTPFSPNPSLSVTTTFLGWNSVKMDTQKSATNGGLEVRPGSENVGRHKTLGSCGLLLRILAMVLTMAAAIVIGVDKQDKVVQLTLVPGLPPLDVPVTAKWHYLSAFVYLMACNAIACSYTAISVLLSISNRNKRKSKLGFAIIVLDMMMVALLFSGNGAAAAVGLLGYHGNSHVQWKKVCYVFEKFCHQVAAAIVLSMLGSVTFLMIVVLSVLSLYKKSK